MTVDGHFHSLHRLLDKIVPMGSSTKMALVSCLILTIVLAEPVLGKEVTLTKDPSPVVVGHQVTFTCNASCYGRDSYLEYSFDPPGEYSNNPLTSFSDRGNSCFDVVQRISFTAKREHTGLVITCSVRDPTSGTVNESATLVVEDKEVTLTQDPSPVVIGQQVTFTCNASCYGRESYIEYSFDSPGEYLINNYSSSRNRSNSCFDVVRGISFTAEREHAGLVITCGVIGPLDSDVENTTLVVEGPPTKGTLCVWDSQGHYYKECNNCTQNVSAGDSLDLQCSTVASNPVSRIMWEVKGQDGANRTPTLRQTNYSETLQGESWFWDVISKARVETREGDSNFSVTCQIFYPDNTTLFTSEHLLVFFEQGKEPMIKKLMLAVLITNGLVVFAVILCCALRCRQQIRKRRKRNSSSTDSEGDNSHPMISLAFKDEEEQVGTVRPEGTSDQLVHKTKSFIPKLEFPRNKIRLQQIIGDGNFGQVHKAKAQGIVRKGVDTTVAVKIIKGDKNSSVWLDFKNELNIFSNLEQHPYVVSILGCCTNSEPYYMIMEYIPNGTLQEYITGKREAWDKAKLSGAANAPKEALSTVHILNFAFQVANGMEYLSSMHLIHRDLATRNVLLGEGLVCKLCDFGLARDVTDSNQYNMLSRTAVPIRWMAVECLVSNTYTTQSDVWSFGILLWELVTLGALPYPGMSPDAIIDAVRQGLRLPRPAHCGVALYKLMASCWGASPNTRPSFTELQSKLDHFLKLDSKAITMSSFVADYYAYV